MDSKEMAPGDIERRSFEIITEELGGRTFPPLEEPVVKRVIHTTADFSYADSLVFTHDAAHCALDALRAHGARRHKQARAREARLQSRVLHG